MLRRLALRDFVIVSVLEVDLDAGFSVLTGETGAGKSILIDALQLALGSRGDAGVVREGATRAEITAEFDAPASLAPWLAEGGFDHDGGTLLLRRTIDAQGKSRAWVNGSAATVTQLREAAQHLVDIHGQHAWQGLTRAASVRALLDAYAGLDDAPLADAFRAWKSAGDALSDARARQDDLERERERLAWQIGELDKLAPGDDEWRELDAEHRTLANAQSLIDASRSALLALTEADENAESLTAHALDGLQDAAAIDPRLAGIVESLQGAQVQLQDAAHSLASYLNHADLDPARLAELDARMSSWMGLARRYRRPPDELAGLLAGWKSELRTLDAAADLGALQSMLDKARAAFDARAKATSRARHEAAPRLSAAVSGAMQQLGMVGGRFEIALLAQDAPQSFGLESAEFRVAGHEGSTPRPLAKVASGGELSRIALAIAVTTAAVTTAAVTTTDATTAPASTPAPGASPSTVQPGDGAASAGTLIFDEIDAGVGGTVAETVGRLMKQLGRDRQVLAVTHLPQVAACADHHHVVAKITEGGSTRSDVRPVVGEARVAEIARMLGGERLSGTSLAHAQEMLDGMTLPRPAGPPIDPAAPRKGPSDRTGRGPAPARPGTRPADER